MDIVVKAKCEVAARVREEARRRIEHAGRFMPNLSTVEVLFGCEPNPRIADPACVELSARTEGGWIRVQGRAGDHRRALDIAVTRLERQLARSSARAMARTRRSRARVALAPSILPAPSAGRGPAEPPEPRPATRFVHQSRVQAAAMLPDEAAARLELLGHDVVVFTNRETGAYGVVYRRPEGGLVLLEPEQEGRNGAG